MTTQELALALELELEWAGLRYPLQLEALRQRENLHEMGIPTRPTACTEPPWFWAPGQLPAAVVRKWPT